jgi:ABC-type sugar transport system, periplasmic component
MVKKKLLAVFLCLLSLPAVFALDTSKKLEISVAVWDVQSAFADQNDPVLKYVQDKFNVVFKPVAITWDDYGQKIRLWAASGDMPDIVTGDLATGNPAEELRMIKNGVFHALPADLSPYPNVKATMALPDVQPLKVNGKFYEFPRLNSTESMQSYGQGRGFAVRKDWMKKAGIAKNPETFDEFVKDLKLLTDKQKGVYGLTLAGANQFGSLIDTQVPSGWVKDASGKWVPRVMTAGFVTAIEQISRLLKEGVLDPDMFLLKDKEGLDKFAQGKAAMVAVSLGPSHVKNLLYDKWVTYPNNPNFSDSVAIIPTWKAADNKWYYAPSLKWWSSSYFSGKMNDEKMARIMAIYDFLVSPDGIEMNLYGLQGIDYTKTGDKITITREKASDGNYIAVGKKYPSIYTGFSYMAMWTSDVTMWQRNTANAITYGPALDIAMDAHDFRMKYFLPADANFKIMFLSTVPDKEKYNGDIVTADVARIVQGSDSDIAGAWKKVVRGYRDQGLDAIVDAVNKAIK